MVYVNRKLIHTLSYSLIFLKFYFIGMHTFNKIQTIIIIIIIIKL